MSEHARANEELAMRRTRLGELLIEYDEADDAMRRWLIADDIAYQADIVRRRAAKLAGLPDLPVSVSLEDTRG